MKGNQQSTINNVEKSDFNIIKITKAHPRLIAFCEPCRQMDTLAVKNLWLSNRRASLPAFEMQSMFMILWFVGAYWEISAVLVGQLSDSSVSGFVGVGSVSLQNQKLIWKCFQMGFSWRRRTVAFVICAYVHTCRCAQPPPHNTTHTHTRPHTSPITCSLSFHSSCSPDAPRNRWERVTKTERQKERETLILNHWGGEWKSKRR